MPSEPRSLWSDGPDEDDHHAWLHGGRPDADGEESEPTREHVPRPRQEPEGPSLWARTRRRLGTPGMALGIVLLLVIGVLIGTQVVGTNSVERTVVQGQGSGASAVKAAYEATHDGVVRVSTDSGNGTGWVYDSQGTIVTNNHVVSGGGSSIKVRFGDRGQDLSARLVETDVSTDLAVLKVDPAKVHKLVPLKLADSDKVQTGDQVLAIGYPLGLDQTATTGIISGVGRQISAQNNFSIDKVLQTDAPINPGNSGGPLLDVKGRVVGVNSQIATTGGGGGNVGIGFAVPSNTVKTVVPQLMKGQKVQHAYLGVQMGDLPGVKGAVVGVVTPGGPASRAGLKAATTTGSTATRSDGDVITGIDGEDVERADDVTRIINDHKPGDRVTMQVQRDGKSVDVDVTLGDRPATTASAGSSGGGGGGGNGGGGGTLTLPTTPNDPTDPNSPGDPSTPGSPSIP